MKPQRKENTSKKKILELLPTLKAVSDRIVSEWIEHHLEEMWMINDRTAHKLMGGQMSGAEAVKMACSQKKSRGVFFDVFTPYGNICRHWEVLWYGYVMSNSGRWHH